MRHGRRRRYRADIRSGRRSRIIRLTTSSGKAISVREHLKDIHVPVYSVGGWYDNYVESDLDAFTALQQASRVNRIMIGPWPHNMSHAVSRASISADAMVPLRPEQLRWFDRWLKGKDSPDCRIRQCAFS